jgi:hypothetical protein
MGFEDMTIEEMRAELEKTWYTVFAITDPDRPGCFVPCVHTPDGLEIRGKAQGLTDGDACKEAAIKMAYVLLQKENEFKAMRVLIEELKGVLSHCLMALKRTMYTDTPNDIETAIDRAEKILYKKNNEL